MDRPILPLCVLLAALSVTAAPTEFFVSTTGSDGNVGSREKPFATLARARDAVRELRTRGGLPQGGVTVWIGSGTYRMPSPLELTTDDQGTQDSPIVYRAETRGAAVVTGGVVLDGWRPVSEPAVVERIDGKAAGRIYEVDIPEGLLDELPGFANGGCGYRGKREFPLALFQDDERLPIARWPNEGYVKMGECLGHSELHGHSGISFIEGIFRFDDPRLTRWVGEPDLWFDGLWFHSWADQKMQLKSIDPEAKTISLRDPKSHQFGFKAGQGFYAFNAISEIDRPGEWAVDRERRRIYLWPGTELSASPVTLAVYGSLVTGEDCAYTTFEGLVFEACRERALVFQNSTAVTVAACTFRHIGSTCVDIDGGSRGKVIGCDMADLGEGGARVSGGEYRTLTPGEHLIENNHIHHFGRIVSTYRPGAAAYGVGNAIRHNLIYQAQHQAIYFHGNDHLVEYNIVHDVCLHTNDAGAIYAVHYDWSERGCIVRHNFIHSLGDPVAGHNSTNGIYMDDQTCGTTLQGNILSLCGGPGIVVSCRDHVISNNISINCRTGFQLSTRGIHSFCRPAVELGRESYQFKKLLGGLDLFKSDLWRQRYPTLLAPMDEDPILAHSARGNTIRNNVAAGSGELKIADKENVMDYCVIENNIDLSEDPGFVDYAHFDLRLRPDAPLFDKLPEFKPIEFEKMGLYDDPLRASPAIKFGPGITPMPPIMSPEEREKAKRPVLCQVPPATASIQIDGTPAPGEWPQADAPSAEIKWDQNLNEAPQTSRAWMATDGDRLCFAFQNSIPPQTSVTNGHQWGTDDAVEIALAPVRDADIGAGLTTTVLRGYPDGHHECLAVEGLTEDQAEQIARNVAFVAKRADRGAWSAEWSIPFAVLGIEPKEGNWPILAHLSTYQAATHRTLGWRRRWARNSWDVKGAYALCLAAFGPVPFAPGVPASQIRIDVQADRNAESSTMEPGEGATAPEWAKKWNRLVTAFGAARADQWKTCQFEFMPLADAVVTLGLMGTQSVNSKLITWTYYDDFHVEGAELINGDFEVVDQDGKAPGWNCVLDQNWETTASSEAGIVENESLAASGKRMARASHDHRVTQQIRITKGQKVTVRFQARGVLPGM